VNRKNIIISVSLLAILALVILFIQYYVNHIKLDIISIQIKRGDEVVASFKVESAVKLEDRVKGLMDRDTLPEDGGMLFYFDPPSIASMWMKNVRFPLDFVFIDSQNRVVQVEKDIPPCNTESCSTLHSVVDVAYVLEITAGSIEKYGIRPGDRLDILE
jgi:uncharacterized membrane protein (UPF0127 family)